MSREIRFERIIVPLSLRPVSRQALEFIVQLARALGLELLGRFHRDESLLTLARVPGIREFRVRDRTWQKLEIGQLPVDLDVAARTAERLFHEASRALGIEGQFEIAAHAQEARAAGVTRHDIQVVCEPGDPVEHLGFSLLQSIEAQLAAGTTFLILPGTIDLRPAHLTALLASPTDPTMAVVRQIAEAAEMTSQILQTGAGDDISNVISNPIFAQSRLVVTGRLPSGKAAHLLRDLARSGSVPVLSIGGNGTNHDDTPDKPERAA